MIFERLSPSRTELLKDAFEQAVAHPVADRPAVLASLNARDPEVYSEALRLAAEYDRAGDFVKPIVPVGSHALSRAQLNPSGSEPPLFTKGDRLCARYEIVRFIGAGGMGEVYEATDPNLGCSVALKTVRMDRLGNPTAQERLRREALLALRVTHPNVCRTLDLNWHHVEGGPSVAVLSMALLRGRTLAEEMKASRFTPDTALPVVRQMIAALDAAHSAGVVHRDFKPANVMLVGDRAVVTDFGLAVAQVPFGEYSLTNTGEIAGTPSYMAPEQLRTGSATPQSDIYSLGVVVFEMLTGTRPTAGSTGFDELAKRLLDPAPSPRALDRRIPVAWDHAIRRALEREPMRRFSSVREFERALDSGQPEWKLPTRRHTAIFFSVCAVCVSSSALVYRYWNQGRAIPPGSVCMLTPIQNGTRDPRLAAYSILLRTQLEQSNRVQPWNSARLPQVLTRMRRPVAETPLDAKDWREIALREGVPLIVMGSVTQVGEEYILQMRLERVGTSPDAPAWHSDRQFRAASVATLADASRDVGNWIRSECGEIAESIASRSRAPSAVTTSSWDALMLYQQAVETDRNDPEKALLSLREAVRLDPDFALAQMRIGDILVTQRKWDEGLPYWESALAAKQRQRLTLREDLALQTRYALEIHDFPAGEAAAVRWAQSFPYDELARWFVFSVRHTQGRTLEAADAIQRIPLGTPEGKRLRRIADAQYYLQLGDSPKLLATANQMKDADEPENAARTEGIAHAIAGNPKGARASFERMMQLPSAGARSRGFLLLNVLLASLGQLDEAGQVLDAGIRHDETAGQRGLLEGKMLSRGYLAWIQGSPTAARSNALEAARSGTEPDIQMKAITLLSRSGYVREAANLLRMLRVSERYPYFRSIRRLAEAESLVARSKADEAIPLITEALRYRSANQSPEPLLYALWKSGDAEEYRRLADKVNARPYYTWSNPEQQFGPATLLTKKLVG